MSIRFIFQTSGWHWMAEETLAFILVGFQRCFLTPQGHQAEHPLQSKAAELAFGRGDFG